MKKDFLKPYVHKVKGAVNYALYDILNGKFYRISPHGDLQTLRKNLLQEGLVFQTEGAVPVKLKLDISENTKNIFIRQLQIRLNGQKEDTCWRRNSSMEPPEEMREETLSALYEKMEFIPVHKIRIEADTIDLLRVEAIIEKLKCSALELYLKTPLAEETVADITGMCKTRGIVLEIPGDIKGDITARRVQLNHFFYSRQFNPCWGHQVAIDANGDIKPCLWSADILGNIRSGDLKKMILGCKFDTYWEATKDSINICKDCEMRYACSDCRVSASTDGENRNAKPSFCDYYPFS